MLPHLFHHLVQSTQIQYPKHIALYDNKQQLSYTELQHKIETITIQLLSFGLSKQERVAIYLGKSIESVISFFAVSSCGAIFVPINPYLKKRQVEHIINDCSPKILITSSQRLLQLQASSKTLEFIEQIILVDASNIAGQTTNKQHLWSDLIIQPGERNINTSKVVSDTDTAAILYTSGSTGKAKGVMLSHQNLLCGAMSVCSYLNNDHHDKILAVLPFSFDYGLSQLTTAFYCGASVVLLEYLLPQDVIKTIVKYKITGLAAVPPLWIQLAGLNWPEQAKQTLRYFTNSGGVLPGRTLHQLRKSLPNSLPYLMYGLTEAFRSTYLEPEFIDSHADSIGKAIPNAEILVINKYGHLCSENEVGELVHCGSLVAKGYWNNKKATTKTFRPINSVFPQLSADEIAVWSGDLVKQDSNGFIYFIERNDEMIKSSGYRISPTEIEEVFLQHHFIVNAVAIGLPHPQLGQSILLICTINSVISVEDLKKFAKQYLPGFMCPKDVIIENELPQTANGKIDRQALIKKFTKLYNN